MLTSSIGYDSVNRLKKEHVYHIIGASQKTDTDALISSIYTQAAAHLNKFICKSVQVCISHTATDDNCQLPMPRFLGFFFFSGGVGVAEASAGRCSMGGDVIFHSSAAADSGSLTSSVSGVSATGTIHSSTTEEGTYNLQYETRQS